MSGSILTWEIFFSLTRCSSLIWCCKFLTQKKMPCYINTENLVLGKKFRQKSWSRHTVRPPLLAQHGGGHVSYSKLVWPQRGRVLGNWELLQKYVTLQKYLILLNIVHCNFTAAEFLPPKYGYLSFLSLKWKLLSVHCNYACLARAGRRPSSLELNLAGRRQCSEWDWDTSKRTVNKDVAPAEFCRQNVNN